MRSILLFLLYMNGLGGMVLPLSLATHPEFAEDTVKCLEMTVAEVEDPQGSLSSWQFKNGSKGFTCLFMGVQCWHNNEEGILALRLAGLGLKGSFPEGLRYCGCMTSLDLSNNNMSGAIPKDLCKWLPFLVSLDLSMNRFSGSIPAEFQLCGFLNELNLAGNSLSGRIPWQLSHLNRLEYISLADNHLSGQIPSNFSQFDPSSFANNDGLCGYPLQDCNGGSKNLAAAIGGGVAGGLVFVFVAGFGIWLWWFRVSSPPSKLVELEADNAWAERIKRSSHSVKVLMFEKPIVRIRFSDLMNATNDFSSVNVIASGRTGTVYKGTLADGSRLGIKRLAVSRHSNHLLKSELNVLGEIRHKNLVPLLGYCIAEREKLLLYKHMGNGSLWECLHNSSESAGKLDWITRLRIGIGAARGLAWLHNSCNPPVIHHNLSSCSIFLDDDFEARITDFGLAKVLSPALTRLPSFSKGEHWDIGYEAPERMHNLVPTLEEDVYGFGVILLELVTGKTPLSSEDAESGCKPHLISLINQLSRNGCIELAIDKSLFNSGHTEELLQMLRVACACVQSNPKERPSMSEVYQLLRCIVGHGEDSLDAQEDNHTSREEV